MKPLVKFATLHFDWWIVAVAFMLVTPLLQAQWVTLRVSTTTLPTLTATGTSSDQQSMTITTSWTGRLNATVRTCVYMLTALTGTNGNPDTIPQANIMVTYGATTRSIVGTNGCGVATGLQVNSRRVRNTRNGSFTVPLQFQAINTGTLAADTYTGTINIIATTL